MKDSFRKRRLVRAEAIVADGYASLARQQVIVSEIRLEVSTEMHASALHLDQAVDLLVLLESAQVASVVHRNWLMGR